MKSAGLFLLLLFGCASVPKPDAALAARQACVRDLNNENIGDAPGFIALGIRKKKEAIRAKSAEEQFRANRCALAAFEAATVMSPKDPVPYWQLGLLYQEQANVPKARENFLAFHARVESGSVEALAAEKKLRELSR
ncbi:MAG: hypothetical protein ACXVB9_07910 [Bdellovibrionota bacterium]